MKKSDIFWQTYLNLEKEAIELSKYIFFTDEKLIIENGHEKHESCHTQLETFSPYISDLLINCCIQIEAISKELYFEKNKDPHRTDNNIYFDTDCLNYLNTTWHTSNKTVLVVAPLFNFTKNENFILRPLKNAHKKQGTYWEKAYQAVKHDRYHNLYLGNVKAFLHALAALYLLNLYYRNDSWIISYNDLTNFDFSGGSKIFTVKPPKSNQLWYNNSPVESDSPYFIKYTEATYKEISNIQFKEYKDSINYLNQQPEYKGPAFQALIKNNPDFKYIGIFQELFKFRLNKKIPKTLPFLTRKELLIKSQEWKCEINQKNKHLLESEITELNIQQELDNAACNMGIEIYMTHNMKWLQKALENKSCQIYIPNANDKIN